MGAVTHGEVLAGAAAPDELVPFGGEHAHKAFALAVGLELLVGALAGDGARRGSRRDEARARSGSGLPRARRRHSPARRLTRLEDREHRAPEVMRALRGLSIPLVWIVVGVVVAAIYDYFDTLGTIGKVLTAIAAVVLWPLLLFGFDIAITR